MWAIILATTSLLVHLPWSKSLGIREPSSYEIQDYLNPSERWSSDSYLTIECENEGRGSPDFQNPVISFSNIYQ